MEELKVNKFGRTYRTGTQVAQARCEEFLFFNLYPNIQLVKLDIVAAIIYYYITTKLHYAKHDFCLSTYGGVGFEVSYFCCNNIKISAKMSIDVFPHI